MELLALNLRIGLRHALEPAVSPTFPRLLAA
jgi:hypothetical protein